MLNAQRLVTFLLFGTACLLAACSSNQIKGEPPFAQIMSWTQSDGRLSVELRLRNVNDEALGIDGLALRIMLPDNGVLTSQSSDLKVSLPAGGSERLTLDLTANSPALEQFVALESGAISSLSYELTGQLLRSGKSAMTLNREGFIYPVPGRSGQFR